MTFRVAITREHTDDGEDFFTVREVYTGEDGKLSWTEEAVPVVADSWQELVTEIVRFGEALDLPILDLTVEPARFITREEL